MLPSQHFSFSRALAPLFLLWLSLLTGTSAYYSSVHNGSFIPDAVLHVTESNITQSCMPTKPVVLVNGTSPGPALRLTEGKTYWIRVYNDMEHQNTTMHWHGLSMAVSPFSDGTPLASQWPIPPKHFFDYEINVPLGHAGTYFYHSHVGFQAISAAGPLIVEDLVVPYEYDEEKIVFLQDVFPKDDATIEKGLVASPLVWSGESAMILVNGKGGGTANGTVCNSSISTINVEAGKLYRFRVVGATALSFVSMAIEGHENMTVIEADGAYSQPVQVDHLQAGSGQRYSFLFQAKENPEKSTYIMQIESRDRPTVTRTFAVINYGPRSNTTRYPPVKAPLTLPNTTRGFLDYDLHPITPDPYFPTAAEVTRRITMTVHQSVRGPTVWVQNSYPWTETFPQEPILVSLYKNEGESNFPSMERALNNSGLDPVTRAFPALIGEVLEIVIQNTGADSGGLDVHPFHAHGEHYWDLGSGNGTYNATENEIKWGGAEPLRRDTSMLYRYADKTKNGTAMGWRAWRLPVNQAGVWMIHCHILQHMVMGMQTVWVFGNETEVLSRVPYPDVQGYLEYGGSVYGNETHWPEVVEFQTDWENSQK